MFVYPLVFGVVFVLSSCHLGFLVRGLVCVFGLVIVFLTIICVGMVAFFVKQFIDALSSESLEFCSAGVDFCGLVEHYSLPTDKHPKRAV